jgi:5-methylthioadenosine/S-adenosylhomocysteine deaminase
VLLEGIDTAFRQDADRSVDHDVDVLVRDGRIDEIGRGLSGDPAIDCRDKVALPGLVNCHSHTPNVLTRGWNDDESLFPWLEANARVLEHAERGDKRAAARLSAALMLETGTTTVNDMWNTYLADDLADVGIRALVGHAMAASGDSDPDLVRGALDANRSFIEDYRTHATIHPAIPVHSVYRATGDLLERAHDLAATRDVPFHVHVSETQRENADCLAARDATPTGWLHDLGVLDHRAVLAHCVHLTDADRERIAASGAGIAHCPASNLKLGSGVADVLDVGDVPVGLGTDSAASNNSLNMFREGRTAALVHKRDDPGAVTAQRVLDMMTREAAAVLGMSDELGSIEAGKRADLVLVDRNDPTLRPHLGDDGLLSNLIYSFHGRVDTAIVEGEVVVEDGTTTTGVGDAMESVQEFCAGIVDRYGGR